MTQSNVELSRGVARLGSSCPPVLALYVQHSSPTERKSSVLDFLGQKQNEISERLAELKPLVEEYERLQAADAVLDGLAVTSTTAPATRRPGPRGRQGPGRPRGSRSSAAATTAPPRAKRASTGRARRGRPKGGGKRAVEALKHITARPGITIPELASRMGIKQNYLYRVLPTLEQAGSVAKQGRGWHPRST